MVRGGGSKPGFKNRTERERERTCIAIHYSQQTISEKDTHTTMCRGSVIIQDGQRGALTTVSLTPTKELMQNFTLQQLKERVVSEVPGIRGRKNKPSLQLITRAYNASPNVG